MIITLADVAKRAGVSRSAVSRTYTEGASVSDKTRSKVMKAAKELGYIPNIIARSLATSRTQLIGLVINNFHNPAFLEVLDQFTRLLQNRNLRPLLVNLSDNPDPADSVEMLRQYRVDAVIVASSTLPPACAAAFKQAGLPVVNVFGRYNPSPDVHVVGIDNRHAGSMAAEILLARRYKSLGFLGGPEKATSTQDRLRGFTDTLKTANLKPTAVVYAEHYSYDAGYKAMHKLMRNKRVDGLFCGDDVIGLGALSAAREAGVCVPGEMGIMGFNNMEMSAWHAFELSTISQPIADICGSAVDLVGSLLENPERSAETRLFPCALVERSTLRGMP